MEDGRQNEIYCAKISAGTNLGPNKKLQGITGVSITSSSKRHCTIFNHPSPPSHRLHFKWKTCKGHNQINRGLLVYLLCRSSPIIGAGESATFGDASQEGKEGPSDKQDRQGERDGRGSRYRHNAHALWHDMPARDTRGRCVASARAAQLWEADRHRSTLADGKLVLREERSGRGGEGGACDSREEGVCYRTCMVIPYPILPDPFHRCYVWIQVCGTIISWLL